MRPVAVERETCSVTNQSEGVIIPPRIRKTIERTMPMNPTKPVTLRRWEYVLYHATAWAVFWFAVLTTIVIVTGEFGSIHTYRFPLYVSIAIFWGTLIMMIVIEAIGSDR